MKVWELIEDLKSYPADMEVKFAYNYGDYWKTEVAADVDSVTNGEVEYSEYHRMDKVVEYDAERDLDDEESEITKAQRRTVCLLGVR